MTTRNNIELGKTLDEFDKALVTAAYFGFLPISAPKITKHDIELSKNCDSHPHYDATEKASVIRAYLEQNFALLPHPISLAYERPKTQKRPGSFGLHFIGTPSGIAEATLIRTALSILSEEGYKNLRVDINCIGGKDSISAYEQELTNYVRKSTVSMSPELQESIKENIFNIFTLKTPETILLRDTAPTAISSLTSQSRSYFKEVLEYIEALGIEFRLAPELVGEKNHTSHTIFAIKNNEDEEMEALAVGYRYSRLGRTLGLRKEVPMTGVNIFADLSKNARRRKYKTLPKPKFYLIQLGREAKIKTLTLIELLRTHHIPLHHFIGKDKITTQLSNAENLRVPYLIIIGQKEALENTVIVRNVTTRAQDTVSISNLPHYLKNTPI